MIYLDNAATSMPKPPGVIRAVREALAQAGSLGRSAHESAAFASRTAFLCRSLAGELFSLPPERVAFTMNATHGLNIAIKTLVKPGDTVVVSGFEHNAVMRPLYRIGAEVRIAGRKLFDAEDTLRAFDEAVTPEVKAVICTHVSNVFGYILPIEEIADLCKERKIPLIVDASQSAGVLPVSVKRLGAAFIAMPGHKGLYGPQGTGLLLCGMLPEPIMEGGTGSLSKSPFMPDFLPDRIEAGTQNIHGIAGLAEGLRFVLETGISEIKKQEESLIKQLEMKLETRSAYEIFSGKNQSGVLSLVPVHTTCEALTERLTEDGFAVRTGLHCAPLAHESAGTADTGTVRVSVSVFSKSEEVDSFAEHLTIYAKE